MRENPPPASASERRRALREYLMGVGTARPQQLADRFEVSLVTIHRDLDQLVEENVVRKHHGSVTALPVSAFEDNVLYRRQLAVTEKRAIARRAVQLIAPGMTIVLDDSTTTAALVPLLPAAGPLTVITIAHDVMAQLMGEPDIKLVGLGGEYSAEHDAFVGAPSVAAAQFLHADLGFSSFGGITPAGGYHQDHMTVMTKRALLGMADRRILLADHAKLGRSGLFQAAELSEFERLITDDGADPATVAPFEEQGLLVEIAEADGN